MVPTYLPYSGATLSGFLDQELLLNDTSSVTIDAINSDIRHWIFPSLRILCDGEITGLYFTNNMSESDMELYPSLTVWSQFLTLLYIYIGGRSLSGVVDRTQELLFATFDPPLPVRAGYIVGLHYPPSGDLSVQPKFLDLGHGGASDSFYSTFETHIFTSGVLNDTKINQYLPLIRPVVEGE